ncbi:MAG: V-type ATP synthase subunit A [Pseudolabrys sp.]
MSEAVIRWVGGPVLHARVTQGEFRLGEAIEVGSQRRPGEVIRLKGDELVGQVYEDTTGLRPGDAVHGPGGALAVRLGPGLLGHIFDGLLRPLDKDASGSKIAFLPLVKAGDTLNAGAPIGELPGSVKQFCLLPPNIGGAVEKIVGEGSYDPDTVLCIIRDAAGATHEIGFFHSWPVRQARPVAERLLADEPMITGQRILDTLFPVARGGQAAIPGGFGTGKTILQETLAKWCDADVIVYVGCGERGNEMAEVLHEFPSLSDPRSGRGLMERTIIIANTSNMPVAAREASIYTAVTVGEYFRDQGLNVALMADSTSRWAEALREVSGRLGELPGEAAYPAYLGSRLAEFYERAAKVKTLGGHDGSLTIIGAVSPPAGDFSEPVTSNTKRYVRSFWGLDRERAQARFFPAIHPLQSYSENAGRFAAWWTERGNSEWHAHRERLLKLL